MKKFKLKLDYATFEMFNRFLQHWVNSNGTIEDAATRMAWVILLKLVDSTRIREKIRFRFKGDKSFTLRPEEAFALAFLIENTNYSTIDYFGNFLQMTYGQLHQYFSTINIT